MMRTILLIIEYDGTDYAGWQIQPNGRAVQEVIEKALAEVLGQAVRIHSSGRTDAGVHARGMAAHFQTSRDLPLTAFREGVNRLLPEDIAIRLAREMPPGFHARFAAVGKWYRYTILQADVRSPLAARRAWYLRTELDVDRMREAAALLVGEHDFKAFRAANCAAKSTIRQIFAIDIIPEGHFLQIDVRGSGFLKNMVRMIVGSLVEVGRGRRSVADLAQCLSGDGEALAGPTAPAKGLCLEQVWYTL